MQSSLETLDEAMEDMAQCSWAKIIPIGKSESYIFVTSLPTHPGYCLETEWREIVFTISAKVSEKPISVSFTLHGKLLLPLASDPKLLNSL